MTNNNHQKIEALNGISKVLILAGPAGVGKTTLANRLIEGPDNRPITKEFAGATSRTDWKSLKNKNFEPGTLIVEFAINRLGDPVIKQEMAKLLVLLANNCDVFGAYLIKPSQTLLLKRYLSRMKPAHYFHVGKWKTIISYAKRPNFEPAYGSWSELMDNAGIEFISVTDTDDIR